MHRAASASHSVTICLASLLLAFPLLLFPGVLHAGGGDGSGGDPSAETYGGGGGADSAPVGAPVGDPSPAGPSCTDPAAGQQCSGSNVCGTQYGSVQCDGSCSVGGPTLPGNYGQTCSGSNQCGTLYGTIGCDGACSVGGPTLPSNYGQSCASAPNSCGAVGYGAIQCNGSCSAQTPAVPANIGQSCTSATNACGQTRTGTVGCGGCSASAPPNSGCPSITVNGQTSVTVLSGAVVTIAWSCAAPNTSASANFPMSGAAIGSKTSAVNTTTTYTILCNQTGGSASATANVLVPDMRLTASPPRVQPGQSSTLTWSANSVQSCTLSGPGVSASATANGNGTIGQQTTSTGVISGQSIYTLSCSTAAGQSSVSATVNLIPSFIEI